MKILNKILIIIKVILYKIHAVELMMLPVCIVLALICRFKKKAISIGIGPEPLITAIYHKQALERLGYSVETFVFAPFFITNKFDIDASTLKIKSGVYRYLYLYYLAISRYQVIYIYFNGGPLLFTKLLRHFEPWLFKIARTKVVVMPYGGDVQDLRLCNNLNFIHSITQDYPMFQKSSIHTIKTNIDRWIKHANHVISGCDWVEYMYHWDTLTLTHFPMDTERLVPSQRTLQFKAQDSKSIKILHCPNHVNIKGTKHFKKAITELNNEGYNIELIFIQNVPNDEILTMMQEVDIVADQLIIGWYAMTAIEAMCQGIPVLCYIKPSLQELYEEAGLLEIDELPLVNCDFKNVKEKIKFLIDNPNERLEIGKRSRDFVIKHHSFATIGNILSNINNKLGVLPTAS